MGGQDRYGNYDDEEGYDATSNPSDAYAQKERAARGREVGMGPGHLPLGAGGPRPVTGGITTVGQGAANRAGYTNVGATSAMRSPLAEQQNSLITMLQNLANGTGKSFAEQAIRGQLAQGQAALQSQAASANPAMAGIANRNATRGIGQLQSGAAHQLGMGRIAEMESARNSLAQVLGQARGQDDAQSLAAFQGDLQSRLSAQDWNQKKLLMQEQERLRQAAEPSFWDKLGGGLVGALPGIGQMVGGLLTGGATSGIGSAMQGSGAMSNGMYGGGNTGWR